MAFYIIEKLSDRMLGDGERLYPKLVNGQMVSSERVADIIERRTSFTRSDVVGVLAELAAVAGEQMAEGNSVKLDGLGVLRPVLGLVDKERRGGWTDGANRLTTGRNVRLKTVNFRPDAALLRHAESGMSLERISDRMGRSQPTTTIDERAAMARQYIAAHGFMRVADYARLTGLSRTVASKELRRLAGDETSGIRSSGSGPGKVYVLASSSSV